MNSPTIRPARMADVRAIRALVEPYVDTRTLVAKPAVSYYETVQEFLVAEEGMRIVGCGALHAMWEDVAEVRTLAVHPTMKGRGLGGQLLEVLLQRARDLGVGRVFCLTFETSFFSTHGFHPIDGNAVAPEVYMEMLQSYDDGVAEFLGLDRVKPNTLGNTRMLIEF